MSAPTPRVAVVVPAYGKLELTRSVVAQCLEEDGVDVYVVDNMGDYHDPVGAETVISPGGNLGWLRGTNRGIEQARERGGYRAFVALNNDVQLSPGFFRGLTEAMAARPDAGLIAPCYDDVFPSQKAYYSGDLAGFVPAEVENDVNIVDGTCLLVTAEFLDRVGLLDAKTFGRHGWGATEDYCLRAKQAGLAIVVTCRSYLAHARGSTALETFPAYKVFAFAEAQNGLRRKWGRTWAEQLGEPQLAATRRLDPLRFAVRNAQDRSGISRRLKIPARKLIP